MGRIGIRRAQAPLTQPGVNIKAGEYLLAVNGRDLRAADNIYSFFEATAGKQVVLKVGPNADDKDSREVTVTPRGKRRESPSSGMRSRTTAAGSIKPRAGGWRMCMSRTRRGPSIHQF